jgi:hypothetical protein
MTPAFSMRLRVITDFIQRLDKILRLVNGVSTFGSGLLRFSNAVKRRRRPFV